MTLTTHGSHPDKKSNEIFLGYFTPWHIENLVPWETKRRGNVAIKGKNRGKQPLFIMRCEAVEKGWSIK